MTVTALLVSHDGARWLPAVLAGLQDQQRRPDRTLAVDTGSSDDSRSLLTEALGPDSVLEASGSFPAAVRLALPHIETDWVWLLHDDANPDPRALAALLDAAEARGADILGPKLREWPSLRRLLELGVTISATGRRETGLERGEYDQGQHDNIREVLAVNTAGMLVRRDVLERLGGFDPALPIFGNDIDFGWRAARAGYRTIVVPEAVVFHAEAAHRGVRRTELTGRRTHRAERRAALFTLLANAERARLVPQAVRLLLGTLLRAFGFLLGRSPRLAADEISALVAVYSRPGLLKVARTWRRQVDGSGDGSRDVKQLLAPWWLPYRHGLDFFSDLIAAAMNQTRDAAERRRIARGAESGPVSEDADSLAADSGWAARLVSSPKALAITAFVLLSLWGAREALGPLSGGALSPAPSSAGDWWRLLTEGWHQIGQGTDAPTPAYLVPFAVAATLLLGKPAVVVSLLFLLAVPLAAWGAWRFLKVVAELGAHQEWSRWLVGWGALTYATLPVASGAWGQGRFGIVASAALLPWLATAALGFLDPSPDRRWRAGWRCALLLAVITAFTPTAWLFAALTAGAVVGLGLALAPDLIKTRSVWLPLLVLVAVPPVLLLPGTIGVLGHDVTAIFLEAGRLAPTPSGLDLVSGRLGSPAAPVWAGLLILAPAVAALARERTRPAVMGAWLLVVLAAVLAAILSHLTISLPAGEARPGLGFLMLIGQGAMITAAVIAGHGVWSSYEGASFTWRQPVTAIVALAAVLVPIGGLGWWLVGDNLLHRPGRSDVPAYMAQAAETGAGHGVLVLRGNVARGLNWEVQRGEGLTLGEDEILALTGPDRSLSAEIREVVSRPTPDAVAKLPEEGIDYIVLPAPADAQVAATLDAAPGIARASAADRSTSAWQLEAAAPGDAIAGERPWWLPLILVLQLIGFLCVAVLCGPTRTGLR